MRLGLHIEILFANFGFLANPQPRVITVTFIIILRSFTRDTSLHCFCWFCFAMISLMYKAFLNLLSHFIVFVQNHKPAITRLWRNICNTLTSKVYIIHRICEKLPIYLISIGTKSYCKSFDINSVTFFYLPMPRDQNKQTKKRVF